MSIDSYPWFYHTLSCIKDVMHHKTVHNISIGACDLQKSASQKYSANIVSIEQFRGIDRTGLSPTALRF